MLDSDLSKGENLQPTRDRAPENPKNPFVCSCGKILVEAFTNNYSATTDLLSKLTWPLVTLLALLTFRSQIATILETTSQNFSHAQSIEIQGVSISFFSQDSNIPQDPLAHAVLANLNQAELEYILLMGQATEGLRSTQEVGFDTDIKPMLDRLAEFELLDVDYNYSYPGCGAGSTDLLCGQDVHVTITSLGKRVYESLVATLIGIMQEIPHAAELPDAAP